ncbi:uncharacterized protein LOC129677524 [Psammomys obesus]|uniref:uncharacterized protein LOC129677524 n=1 Tax=Psammomys obesus TaxID=48139 RepID=UPI002452DD82|nr:uncharacterized protein LOC129677524 [Psammomys obesus]
MVPVHAGGWPLIKLPGNHNDLPLSPTHQHVGFGRLHSQSLSVRCWGVPADDRIVQGSELSTLTFGTPASAQQCRIRAISAAVGGSATRETAQKILAQGLESGGHSRVCRGRGKQGEETEDGLVPGLTLASPGRAPTSSQGTRLGICTGEDEVGKDTFSRTIQPWASLPPLGSIPRTKGLSSDLGLVLLSPFRDDLPASPSYRAGASPSYVGAAVGWRGRAPSGTVQQTFVCVCWLFPGFFSFFHSVSNTSPEKQVGRARRVSSLLCASVPSDRALIPRPGGRAAVSRSCCGLDVVIIRPSNINKCVNRGDFRMMVRGDKSLGVRSAVRSPAPTMETAQTTSPGTGAQMHE